MPDAPGLELIAQELDSVRSGAVLSTYHERGQACLIVDPDAILDVLRWLRDTPNQRYSFLASVHGVDYLPAEPRFGVVYELLSMERVERLRVRAALHDPAAPSDDDEPGRPRMRSGGGDRQLLPEIDSVVELFPTAEFQEREVYEFFGIIFRRHPDLRRILLPETYTGWPQRRDFPVGGEPVVFTYNERETPRWWE
jgi:NADH-quinone oxidoreductase subunit C